MTAEGSVLRDGVLLAAEKGELTEHGWEEMRTWAKGSCWKGEADFHLLRREGTGCERRAERMKD